MGDLDLVTIFDRPQTFAFGLVWIYGYVSFPYLVRRSDSLKAYLASPGCICLHHMPPNVNFLRETEPTQALEEILAIGGRADEATPNGSSSSTNVTLRTRGVPFEAGREGAGSSNLSGYAQSCSYLHF